jgi:hypothetical protein
MRAYQFITEASEPVGREYQHIEDLVYIYGPEGAIRALQRLQAIDKNSKELEVKWDGSPAIYFGRDENGNFHFGDKYHKTLNQSRRQLIRTYTKGKSLKTMDSGRQQFITDMAKLWPLYEKATPGDFRGYLEAGLLYSRLAPAGNKLSLTKQGNQLVFQPNTVIYRVDADTPLGQRIENSITGAAATGYFKQPPGLGGQREAVGNHANGFGSNSVVIIPRKTSEVQVKLDNTKLSKVANFIKQSASKINQFITPSKEWAETYPTIEQATTAWRTVIYTYVNSQVDEAGGLENLGNNMAQWAETQASPSTLTKGRRPLAIAKIKQSEQGKKATFEVVRAIMNLKDEVISQVEQRTLGSLGITAEIPIGAEKISGGEGFVDDPSGGTQPLKFVKRGAFTKANRAKDRTVADRRTELANKAKQALSEDSGKTAVVGWGRGMGHKGHMYLAKSVIDYANKIGATPFFFVSEKVGPDDPLPPYVKLKIYKKVFPGHKEIFDKARQIIPALTDISNQGYNNLVFIVGEDQKESFKFLQGKTKSGNAVLPFDNITVMSRQETGSDTSNLAGPRATPMRDILRNPLATTDEKFEYWRDAMPNALSDSQVMILMKIAAKKMGVPIEQELKEADNPNYFGGSSMSPIPGTPEDLNDTRTPAKKRKDARRAHKKAVELQHWMGHK